MYAYCSNNPIMWSDPCGTCLHHWQVWRDCDECKKRKEQFANSVFSNARNVLVGLATDAVLFNPYNVSEKRTLCSNYFSAYKGAFVIRTPFDSSFSFGFIGLRRGEGDPNVLKHEYGHFLQFKRMGITKYTHDVAIPSVMINLLDRKGALPYDYYSYPWEAEANKLGNANLSDGNPPLPTGENVSFWDLIPLFFK